MKKKTICRAAAAIVLGATVAGALVWVSSQDTGPSLSYEELLALAGDSQAAAEVESEMLSPSADSADEESFSVYSELLEETTEEEENALPEEAASSEEEALEEIIAEIEAEASSAEASSAAGSEHAGSVPSSGASHSTAAPSHPASEAVHSSSAAHSSSVSSEKTCDEQLAECIRQIEALQLRSERELYGIIYDAWKEYMAHPAKERNLMLKISVVLSKGTELTAAQSRCDKEFEAIVTEMRKILRENGRSQALADEAEKTYKQKKNAMIKELTDQAYSGGDGSGQSGKWLAEKASEVK
mgnify:CR=1 FL=1